MENLLKTYISPVFYRSPANPRVNPEDTHKETESQLFEYPSKKKQLCLLDELLVGGITVRKSVVDGIQKEKVNTKTPGLFVLISGPPGSGKSTLAFELCYRLSINKNSEIGDIGLNGISSIYVSSESSTPDLIDQANTLGWDEGESKVIVPWATKPNPELACVRVYGREHALLATNAFEKGPEEYFKLVHSNWSKAVDAEPYRASIIVYDSLNILPGGWVEDEVMRALINTCMCGPLLMIAVLDTGTGGDIHQKPIEWDYYADLSILLNYGIEESYLVRKMQIVKARYQDHADGVHRLKINAKPSEEIVRHPMSPFIKEGGIFVFPSVHRQLSVARRQKKKDEDSPESRKQSESIYTPFKNLDEIIEKKGFPRGYCTAIVGSRGGMKSHLAYYSLLKYLRDEPKERAIIISLRDAEEAALNTLSQILANQRDEKHEPLHKDIKTPKQAKTKLEKYLDHDILEILFFWPGYISPDEFFHLVRVAIGRSPKGKKPVSLVVINGLEQLSARFPLCAEEKMFVSGLVTLLCSHKTTNIVVSGGDASAPSEIGGVPAGLLQMADLIIESSFRLLPKASVWSKEVWSSKEGWDPVVKAKQSQKVSGEEEKEPHVIYQIIRGPGARECRRRVLFYMGRQGDPNPIYPGSVYVRLLPDDFPYGDKI